MTYVIIILIIMILVTFLSLFGISENIVKAGGNPSKVISEVFKKEDNHNIKMSEGTNISDNTSIIRWRTVCGILFGLTMLFFFTFWRRPGAGTPPVYIYPWIKYAFLAVLCSTILAFFVLWKKERDLSKKSRQSNDNEYKNEKNKVGFIGRLISAIVGIVASIYTIGLCFSFGFKGYFIIILCGGYAVAFLWIAVKGRKPY